MEKQYITMYARLKCDKGCMENYLNVAVDHGVYKLAEDGTPFPVMNANDISVKPTENGENAEGTESVGYNIPSFGRCSSKNNTDYLDMGLQKKLFNNIKNAFTDDGVCECVPYIQTCWIDTNEANQLHGAGCLTQASRLVCAKGGIISIVEEPVEEEEGSEEEEA